MKTKTPSANNHETLHSSSLLARLSSGLHTVSEGVAELIWPTRCVLCDVPGTLLCDKCRLETPYIDPVRACPYCGQAHGKYACIDCNSFMVRHRGISSGSKESEETEEDKKAEESAEDAESIENASPLDQIASVFEFVDPARKLVTTYKDRKEIRLANVLAELLNSYLNPTWITPGDTGLVVIPARKQAIRERGFDHMQQIGERLARLSGLPLLDLIEPQERGDQRGLSAARRQKNMRNSFAPKPENARKVLRFDHRYVYEAAFLHNPEHDRPTTVVAHRLPATVILVDDVLTTGATLTAAATVLKEMGIQQVFALTLGRIP